MAPDAKVCANCGYDERAGFQAGRGVGATATRGGILKCPNCGYDFKGLRTNRCPECGLVASRVAATDKEREAEERRFMRVQIGIPLAAGVMGLIAWAVTLSIHEPDWANAILRLEAMLAAGAGLYWLLVIWWLGADVPPGVLALRIGAAMIWGQVAMAVVASLHITLFFLLFIPIGILSLANLVSLLVLTRRDILECGICGVSLAVLWYALEFMLCIAGWQPVTSNIELFWWIFGH